MAKKTNNRDVENESLREELQSLIPLLDQEGLAFLVSQARIHLYNMRVDEQNKAAIAEAGKTGKASARKAAAGKTTGFSIKGSESGSSFYLHYGNNDMMFSRAEMVALSKIVDGPGTDLEIRERLYNWFVRERSDIFALANIKDTLDERLKDLAAVIKKSAKKLK